MLSANARPAWLADARQCLNDRRAERDTARARDTLARARGQMPIPGVEPAGVRRRQDAARRLPPLPDGRRDVIAPVRSAPVPCQRSLHVEVGKHTAWLIGEDVRGLLAVADSQRHQYDPARDCWMVPVDFADHVMVTAEWRQRRFVTCEAVNR